MKTTNQILITLFFIILALIPLAVAQQGDGGYGNGYNAGPKNIHVTIEVLANGYAVPNATVNLLCGRYYYTLTTDINGTVTFEKYHNGLTSIYIKAGTALIIIYQNNIYVYSKSIYITYDQSFTCDINQRTIVNGLVKPLDWFWTFELPVSIALIITVSLIVIFVSYYLIKKHKAQNLNT